VGAARGLLIQQREPAGRSIDGKGTDGAGLLAAKIGHLAHGENQRALGVQSEERGIC
jgi:hypothetical protein